MVELIYDPWFWVLEIALVLLVLVLLARTRRQERELHNLRAAAAELLVAAQTCLNAEYERRKKLLPGAPVTSYTQKRIDKVEAAIARVKSRAQ